MSGSGNNSCQATGGDSRSLKTEGTILACTWTTSTFILHIVSATKTWLILQLQSLLFPHRQNKTK